MPLNDRLNFCISALFPLMSLFCSSIQSEWHIVFSCHNSICLWSVTVPVLPDLDTWQQDCLGVWWNVPQLDFCFLTIEVMDIGEEWYRSEMCLSVYHIRDTWYHVLLLGRYLDHLIKVVPAMFLHCKVPVFYCLITNMYLFSFGWSGSSLLCKGFL